MIRWKLGRRQTIIHVIIGHSRLFSLHHVLLSLVVDWDIVVGHHLRRVRIGRRPDLRGICLNEMIGWRCVPFPVLDWIVGWREIDVEFHLQT